MQQLMTQRQLASLRKLPSQAKVVGTRDGCPVVQAPDGHFVCVLPNGALARTSLVQSVRSYLQLERA
jgi:hypothetical protein